MPSSAKSAFLKAGGLLFGLLFLGLLLPLSLEYRFGERIRHIEARFETERMLKDSACPDTALSPWTTLPDHRGLKIRRASLTDPKEPTPCAILYQITTFEGYNGEIALLAVKKGGRLSALDVLSHGETPGVGDRITPERSPFLSHLLAALNANTHADTLSGATISSGAVLRALEASRPLMGLTESASPQ